MGKTRKRRRKAKIVRLGTETIIIFVSAFVTAFVMALVFPPLLRNFTGEDTGAKVPEGDFLYGIDISHHNSGRIVWDSLRVMTDNRRRTVRSIEEASEIKPVNFVFIKATEGALMRDPDFKTNWKDAGKTGLRRGAYHFFLSSKDGDIQAANFIKAVGDIRARDLPPVLDIETIHKGCSKELLNERALQWLREIEKRYGRKPVVYSGASFAKDYLLPAITDNYELWIAHYGKSSPAYDKWTYWQFTDRAVVFGVPGRVDLSVRKKAK